MLNKVLDNHRNVIGYLKAVAQALISTTETAPEGVPAELAEEVQAGARKYAQILDVAAQVLAEPPVIMTVMVEAARAAREHEEAAGSSTEEPEIKLTSRKVAQA